MLELVNDLQGSNAMVAVTLSVTFISLILRLVARYRQKLSFGMDDYLATLAWIIFLGVSSATIYGQMQEAQSMVLSYAEEASISAATTNTEIESIEQTYSQEFATLSIKLYKSMFAAILCNIIALGLGRLSAVFFYRRIFCTTKRDTFDILTKVVVVTICLWTVGFFLSSLLSCGTDISNAALPTFAYYSNGTTRCILYDNQASLAVTSTTLDLLVLILPLPKIWNLKTTGTRKFAISAVFFIAFISLAASCIRTVAVFSWKTTDYGDELDFINQDTFYFQLLETAACLTAINMPSIWYFLHHWKAEKFRKMFSSLGSFRSSSKQESAEKSNSELLKNESTEFSDSGAVPTRRAHLELETSHFSSQDENAEGGLYGLEAVHCRDPSA